jgi:nitrate reductase beta subunit
MAKVKNWQIGRDMEYPIAHTPPKKQVTYIFDINKCIECQTCTVACKTGWTSGKGQEHVFYNNVETKPYGGYPQQWDVKLLASRDLVKWKRGTLTTPTIFEDHAPLDPPTGHRPTEDDYASPNLGEDDIFGRVDRGAHVDGQHPMWMFYLARICNHCEHPACLAACPRKAIYKREEDGIVLIDQERCRGYQECIKACPYKKTFFNMVSRTSEKCIGCYPRVENGEVALCVESCIGKIRMHGFSVPNAEPDPKNPIDLIVKIRKLALPLYPHFGTSPNVFYIPPIHVPEEFLEQMFGPNVHAAKELYRRVSKDRELLGALLLFGASTRIITRFEVQGDEAVGWDATGAEVARVPMVERAFERERFDEKHGTFRHNLM